MWPFSNCVVKVWRPGHMLLYAMFYLFFFFHTCCISVNKKTTINFHRESNWKLLTIYYIFADVNITSDGWLEWNENQYYIHNTKQAMEDARQFCQKRHGDLVTINTEAERVFLWKQVSRYIYTTLLVLFNIIFNKSKYCFGLTVWLYLYM